MKRKYILAIRTKKHLKEKMEKWKYGYSTGLRNAFSARMTNYELEELLKERETFNKNVLKSVHAFNELFGKVEEFLNGYEGPVVLDEKGRRMSVADVLRVLDEEDIEERKKLEMYEGIIKKLKSVFYSE